MPPQFQSQPPIVNDAADSNKSHLSIPTLMLSIIVVISVAALLCFYFTTFPYTIYTKCLFTPVHPQPPPTSLHHIMFGIAASAETWHRRHYYSDLWWHRNTTRGYIWMNHPVTPWPPTSPPYRVSENTNRFRYTARGSREAIRIARIVKENFVRAPPGIRWFVMGDDDTVFFPDNLVTVLRKYDHRKMHYIGSISESIEQDVVHSYNMAYGGGGFAISYPLAIALDHLLDGCIDRYDNLYGSDQKIGACIAEIGIPLQHEQGFHQFDIRESTYGILSAHPLAPLVTLHHLDHLKPLFPGITRVGSIRKLISAYRHDPARILQHTLCYDSARGWSISVAWGYSIQVYPFFMKVKDMDTPLQTFFSWRTPSQREFSFDTRPLPLDSCAKPVRFFLDGIPYRGPGKTVTRYARSPADEWELCDRRNYKPVFSVEAIYVTAPILNPSYYNQTSPRRQCCDIQGDAKNSDVVRMRIRDCRKGESVNPVPLS